MEAFCNYYGQLGGELLGEPWGIFAVNEAFARIVEKQEAALIKKQQAIIETLKRTFIDEIKDAKKAIDKLAKRVLVLESKKEKKEELKDE